AHPRSRAQKPAPAGAADDGLDRKGSARRTAAPRARGPARGHSSAIRASRLLPCPKLRAASKMSKKHPIISITGSSGAGTTSVKRTFEQIFHREKVEAAYIEGDAFHRYSRAEMRCQMTKA